MSYRCDYCHKGAQRGHRVSHAKNRTLRRFKPNLHWRRVIEHSTVVRRLLCTRCLRKAEKVGGVRAAKKTEAPTMKPLAFATA